MEGRNACDASDVRNGKSNRSKSNNNKNLKQANRQMWMYLQPLFPNKTKQHKRRSILMHCGFFLFVLPFFFLSFSFFLISPRGPIARRPSLLLTHQSREGIVFAFFLLSSPFLLFFWRVFSTTFLQVFSLVPSPCANVTSQPRPP